MCRRQCLTFNQAIGKPCTWISTDLLLLFFFFFQCISIFVPVLLSEVIPHQWNFFFLFFLTKSHRLAGPVNLLSWNKSINKRWSWNSTYCDLFLFVIFRHSDFCVITCGLFSVANQSLFTFHFLISEIKYCVYTSARAHTHTDRYIMTRAIPISSHSVYIVIHFQKIPCKFSFIDTNFLQIDSEDIKYMSKISVIMQQRKTQ